MRRSNLSLGTVEIPRNNSILTSIPSQRNDSQGNPIEQENQILPPKADEPVLPPDVVSYLKCIDDEVPLFCMEKQKYPYYRAILRRCPWITAIDARGNNLTDTDIAWVMTLVEEFPRIKKLNLSVNNITNLGFLQIKELNKRGVVITLDDNDLDAKNAETYNKVLLKIRRCVDESSEVLTLSDLGLTDQDLPVIMTLLKRYPQIKTVDFRHNNITAEGACYIMRNNFSATTINLKGNVLGSKGALAILAYNKMNSQVEFDLDPTGFGEVLSLRGRNIEDKDLPRVMDFLNGYHFKTLDLSNNSITAEGARYIMENNHCATTINLAHNHLGNEGAKNVAIYNQFATRLDLSGNEINAQGIPAFMKYNRAPWVDLSTNPLQEEGARHIAMANRPLRTLKLGLCLIGPQGALHLAHSNVAADLDLTYNSIGPEVSLAFLEQTSAQRVNLSHNGLTDREIQAFLEMRKMMVLVLDDANSLPETHPETWSKLKEHNVCVKAGFLPLRESVEEEEPHPVARPRNFASFWNKLTTNPLRRSLPSHRALSRLGKKGLGFGG